MTTPQEPPDAEPGRRAAWPSVDPSADARRAAGASGEPPLPPELSPRRQLEEEARRTRARRNRERAAGAPGGRRDKPPASPPPPPPRPRTRGGRRRWPRRLGWTALVVVIVLILAAVGTYVWADQQLNRADVLREYAGRPSPGAGTNWLIVGSDSRDKLTPEQEQQLHTGHDAGRRTDTIMVLHYGSGTDTLVSIPRDSWVTIPGHGQGKINSAYSLGGAALLARTVETSTGLRMNHYAEIGFEGFVSLVDAVGGVPLCLKTPVVDQKSGADLKAGCQTLNGTQSLAFVRARYFDPSADLGRVKRQQQFLSALAGRLTSASVLLNPFRLYPALNAGLDALTVDSGASLWGLGSMGLKLKGVEGGSGRTTTVPLSNANYPTSQGDAVLWDPTRAKALFDGLR